MIRNLKALGLALMALCAFGAVMASGASAQEQGELTSDGPVTLTGVEDPEAAATENRLTSFGGFIQCPGSTYTGHAVKTHAETTATEEEEGKEKHEPIIVPATTATLTPHYKQTTGPGVTPTEGAPNCTGPLGVSATVDMNGCDYVVHLGNTTPEGNNEGTYGVTFDIVCPPEQTITVTLWRSETEHTNNPSTPFCDLHVADEHEGPEGPTPTNQGLAGAHATDLNNGEVRLHGTVEGIHVTRTLTHGEPGLLCSNGETSTAKFDLNAIVSGDDAEGKATEIELSDE